MDTHSADAVPAVLSDLIAAGLVSHEMIGDPARLAAEAPVLRELCARVGGTVYRMGRFHYAFRAGAGDLDGQLGALAPGDWAGALEGALQNALGTETVWVNAASLMAGEPEMLDQTLLLLRAHDAAVSGGLAAASPGVRAVVDARYATEIARLTAGAGPGSELDARLSAIEARQAEVLARIEAVAEQAADFEKRLCLTLAEFLAQIEPQMAAARAAR